MNFNAIQDTMVIDRVSDSILQLSFKILPHVEFWVVSKKNFHSYLKKLLKFPSLFQHLCEAGFFFFIHASTYVSQQIECRSMYENPAVFC